MRKPPKSRESQNMQPEAKKALEPQLKLLSSNPSKALSETLMILKKLENVLLEETKVLENSDNKGFLTLQEKKLVVAREYQHIITQVMARKKEFTTANADIKNRIKQAQDEFIAVSEKNLKAIDRMKRCTERLGNSIRNSVIRETQNERGYSYGENGTIATSARRKAVSSGLSETA